MKEYGISKELMDNCVNQFHLSWFTRLKFWLFAREVVEFSGPWRYQFYVYKGVLYLVDIKHIFK